MIISKIFAVRIHTNRKTMLLYHILFFSAMISYTSGKHTTNSFFLRIGFPYVCEWLQQDSYTYNSTTPDICGPIEVYTLQTTTFGSYGIGWDEYTNGATLFSTQVRFTMTESHFFSVTSS